MGEYRFKNGKSDATNVAELLEQMSVVFSAATALESSLSRRKTPKLGNIYLVITFGFAVGIEQMFDIGVDSINNGLIQNLAKYNDGEAIYTQIIELGGNPRYSQWIAHGSNAVRLYLETNDPVSCMTKLVKAYFDTRD